MATATGTLRKRVRLAGPSTSAVVTILTEKWYSSRPTSLGSVAAEPQVVASKSSLLSEILEHGAFEFHSYGVAMFRW